MSESKTIGLIIVTDRNFEICVQIIQKFQIWFEEEGVFRWTNCLATIVQSDILNKTTLILQKMKKGLVDSTVIGLYSLELKDELMRSQMNDFATKFDG